MVDHTKKVEISPCLLAGHRRQPAICDGQGVRYASRWPFPETEPVMLSFRLTTRAQN